MGEATCINALENTENILATTQNYLAMTQQCSKYTQNILPSLCMFHNTIHNATQVCHIVMMGEQFKE